MERDFVGYGQKVPHVMWPEGANIAVNFVLNYEEGSERNILDGDDQSESYLTDLPGISSLQGQRHLSVESLFEYGSRSGIWRLLNLFDEYRIPLTVFACGLALARNADFAEALKRSGYEVAGHGYRWIDYRTISEAVEKEHIQKTIEIIERLTQKKAVGWYTGRRSVHTRKLIAQTSLLYDSDSYADDLPYWVNESGRPLLIIPYNLDTNDARYALSPGWNSGEDFYQYLKATFDQLYREGAKNPKIMTVGTHARLSGKPGRTDALRRFIDYIQGFEKVWVCRRSDIAEHWVQHHPVKGSS